MRLNTKADVELLKAEGYSNIVLASGVLPRALKMQGADRPEVVSYLDVLRGKVSVGKHVAIIGAGGIGFDVADFLTHDSDAEGFHKSWGIDESLTTRGGLVSSSRTKSKRSVHLLQRSPGKPGAKLGKTTGWIHRMTLRERGVKMWGGVTYSKLDHEGLHLNLLEKGDLTLQVDTVVVCSGQVPFAPLEEGLKSSGMNVSLIGGASNSKGLDAQRAIREGLKLATKLAAELEAF